MTLKEQCYVKTQYVVCTTTAGPFILSASCLWLFGLAVPLLDVPVQQSIICKENNSVDRRPALKLDVQDSLSLVLSKLLSIRQPQYPLVPSTK